VTSNELDRLSVPERANDFRLACQAYCLGDAKIHVPAESFSTQQRIQVEGLELSCRPDPSVRFFSVKPPRPTLTDHRADDQRVLDELEKQQQTAFHTVDLEVLREASSILRSSKWEVWAGIRGDEVVGLWSRDIPPLGLAIDLGTTKIAAYLVDLHDARTLASKGAMNPQISFGEDVMTRLVRAKLSGEDAVRLSKMISEEINRLCTDLCAESGADPKQIVDAVVVGNTAMHHLFLLLPVHGLSVSPYVPTVRYPLDLKAREVGIRIAPGAYVHFLPNVAGFVGADHVATLLATSAWQTHDVVLVMDIGTNTEICLIRSGNKTSVSCPSGPTFEGAHIKHGMRASLGAIEHVRLVEDRVEYVTIGGGRPVGLCGSGILDAIAQLRLAGIVDSSGRIGDHALVRDHNGQREFVVVGEDERAGREAITVTQQDVRQLQLAKGAIAAGIRVLLEAAGCSGEEIGMVIIGGAFGSYIDIASAITIGMLPDLSPDHFIQVGNTAGLGAKLALVSLAKRKEAASIAREVAYIELAAFPGFAQIFAQSTLLGRACFHSGETNGN